MREDIPAAGHQAGSRIHGYSRPQRVLYVPNRSVGDRNGREADKLPGFRPEMWCGSAAGSGHHLLQHRRVDPYGKAFCKEVNVAQGKVQALWFGVDIPQQARPGKYTGNIEIKDGSGRMSRVPVTIRIEGNALADRGGQRAVEAQPPEMAQLYTGTGRHTDIALYGPDAGRQSDKLSGTERGSGRDFFSAYTNHPRGGNEMLARPIS